jgi:DnaK suppressor protein
VTERHSDQATRERLEAMRAELVAREDDLPIRMENQDDDYGSGHHPGDDATELFMQERNIALRGVNADTIAEIDAALARLDAGVYGICEECGAAIGEERLEARPFATRCIACQARAEQSAG